MMNIRKNINILSLFAVFAIAFVVVAMPVKAQANDAGRILDPLCLFLCDRDDNTKTVVKVINTNTNTNTVNAPTPTVVVNPTYPSTPTYPNYTYNPLYVSCYSTPTSAGRGDTIHWRTSISGGTGDYYITWSGSDGLSGHGTSVNKVYHSSGSKYASVHVTSGGQTISKNCANNVDIYSYGNDYDDDRYYDHDYDDDYDYDRNLTVSCYANTTFAPVGNTVTWTAHASGGNGRYTYDWDGTDYLSGRDRTIEVVYNGPGTKTARVSVRSGGREISRTCTNSVLVGAPIQYQAQNYYPTYNPPAAAPVVKTVVVEKEVEKANPLSAATYFSLSNVPWGWVAILIILILLSMVIYLLYNKKKI